MKFEEIMDRRRALADGPILALPAEKVDEAAERIAKATPTSKALYEKAKAVIPGGCQHMLAFSRPYPLTIRRAEGVYFYDADGNRYTDYLMMAGPVILGHNYPPLIDKLCEVMQTEGVGSGWNSEWEIKGSEMIAKHFRSVDLVRYFQSGTEADMAAARLSRAYTGKQKIIRIGGAYHGWSAEFIYDMQIPHAGPFQCAGIPEEYYAHIVSVPPNDIAALEQAFNSHKENVAALIVEPLGGESGAMPAHPDFFKTCRELCDRHDAILIFDEVVTGFRLAMGGAQEYYGIEADLTVFGKIITHGLPSSGALGGHKDIMECLAGLNPSKPKPFVAGTMAGNAISTSATYWTIRYMEEENALEKADKAAEILSSGLNRLFEALRLPFFSYRFASIVHFETAAPLAVDIRRPGGIESALARKQAVDDLAVALLAEGVVTKYGARAFNGMAHTEDIVNRTLNAFETVLKMISR
jgi:glutamate-1-semialdehyde 2,1-aminomutase